MRLRVVWFAVVLALAAFGLPGSRVDAQSVFERLVMPGPLIRGHENLEKKCEACHEPFTRASQSALCLACHKPIAADRQQQTGFHGKSPDARGSECRLCHSEHRGRDVDITGLDPQLFNHAMTDFALEGAHRAVACGGCHAAGKPHREAPRTCIGCHKSDEPHRGQLGADCTTCHSVERWRPAKVFDHSATRFPLRASHEKVACQTCHAGEIYKPLAMDCVSCHAINDHHQGRYGAKCETCHQPSKWPTVSFRHDVATRFPLRGAHARTKCDACHTGDLYRVKLETSCVSCHGKKDPHKGQLGARCETCHNETAWRDNVKFDHDLTRFPLIGRHAKVACAQCHKSRAYKDAPRACVACHADRFHQGRLGAQCAACHDATGWKLWHFDHDRQTTFPLAGAHKTVGCHGCHAAANPSRIALPKTCISCHAKDDAHAGAFGPTCDRCHSTTSFRQNVLRR